MKQGRRYTTIILWIILAAIMAYFGYHLYSAVNEPLTTAAVVEYEAGAGYYATGYVVRDEHLIVSDYELTVITAQEGARVATGEPVATGYLSEEAQARQRRISELSAQLETLSYAKRYSGSVADRAELDSEIASSLASLARYLSRRDMNSALDISSELKGMVLRRSSDDADTTVIQAQITATQNELDKLREAAGADTKSVSAPAAGYFSAGVDGYERVLTPEKLETMSYRDYNALSPETAQQNTAGKLIYGNTWYYVTLIPSGELEGLAAGDDVTVTFARDFYESVEMQIERIGANEAGYRVLVLSCDRYMQNVTLLRQQSAEVVFSLYAGLRVPKEAVRVDEDGQAGVYTLEGAVAKWKPITILHDNGESYVVELDRSATSNLWPGDEVIVTAKNLYDGKVVG